MLRGPLSPPYCSSTAALDESLPSGDTSPTRWVIGLRNFDRESEVAAQDSGLPQHSVLFPKSEVIDVLIFFQDWDAAVAELRDFGDRYPTRRNKEADLLENDDGSKGDCDSGMSNWLFIFILVCDGMTLLFYSLFVWACLCCLICVCVVFSIQNNFMKTCKKEESFNFRLPFLT